MSNIWSHRAQLHCDQTSVRTELWPFNSAQQEKHAANIAEANHLNAEYMDIKKLNGLLFYAMMSQIKLLQSTGSPCDINVLIESYLYISDIKKILNVEMASAGGKKTYVS